MNRRQQVTFDTLFPTVLFPYPFENLPNGSSDVCVIVFTKEENAGGGVAHSTSVLPKAVLTL